jgi:flavin reductase (DIM6/NTAB) family NADH-FMN oxidoreductase RutF
MKGADGNPYAITVSSVTSISMEPPSLLVCINKSARVHDSIKEGSDLCINLLTKDQEEISNICSSESQFDKRFDDKNWDKQGIPYLANAQANIFCKVDKLISYHTHSIVIAHVLDANSKESMNTLVYANGKYA